MAPPFARRLVPLLKVVDIGHDRVFEEMIPQRGEGQGTRQLCWESLEEPGEARDDPQANRKVGQASTGALSSPSPTGGGEPAPPASLARRG